MRSRGFTLVEMAITVAILALAAAVVIPAMNNVSRAELRRAASAVAATVRANYDNAALSGQTYRMVFPFGAKGEPGGPIRTESTQEQLNFDDKSGAFITAAQDAEELHALKGHPGGPRDGDDKKKVEKKAPDEDKASALTALFGISKLGQRAASSGFQQKGALKLDDSIHLLDVWTDGMDKAAAEGEVYLYFFPNGYTQEALIHLEDSDKRVFTVKIAPLTGKAEILDSYIEVAK